MIRLLPVTLLLACAGQPGTTGEITHRPPPDSRPAPGAMSAPQVRQVMQMSEGGFNNCFKRAAGSFVAGEVLLEFDVGEGGRVEHVSVEQSDLGSWVVEDCLVQVARFLEFTPPTGGRARFTYPFTHSLAARRLSTPVDESFGYATIRAEQPAIRRCREIHGFADPFFLTFYIGRLGQVMSAGFDSQVAPPEQFPACVVQHLEGVRFPDPGPRIVKYRALVEDLPDGTDPHHL